MKVSSVSDIIALDEGLTQLTKDFPGMVRPGSLLRIHVRNRENWGIVETEKNLDALRERERFFRTKDRQEVKNIDPVEIDNLLSTDTRASLQNQMAHFIGATATSVMRGMGDEEIAVCDLGARFGKATSAVIAALGFGDNGDEILERTVFHLMERSFERLDYATRGLDMGIEWRAHSIQKQDDDYEEMLGRVDSNSINIMITLSQLHHHPRPEILKEILRVLKPGGVLIAGDWHARTWSDPMITHHLLKLMGANESRLKQFRELFELKPYDPFSTDPGTSMEESRAVEAHIAYWAQIYEKSREANAPQIRRYFLG
ncbi:TPA: methyltransferase domain-containing protein, partial [Candidatus Micrarchaeota archaeon]|nr:methyltransferase domain-containing protein [Candidatus Micrarchaeota archaeon]